MVFPHYTLHDESHSRAILENIQRVLGERVVQSLSVTDLWMLLCAAYYHDIGMFVEGVDIEKTFKNELFLDYVEGVKNDADSPLNRFAVVFDRKNEKLVFNKVNLDVNSYNAARYLLADFMRKKHAERSMAYVEENDNGILLHNGLERLIKFIAKCCKLHYENFEDVLKMSRRDNGVNGDDCHPVFIACMLRLGDLLDFDTSRVSNVLMSHLYSSIPADSIIHNTNALKCVSASISSTLINVEIECDDCDSANEVDRLFSWIREEMNNQRNAWYDISAGIQTDSLPMLGDLKISLTNGYDTVDDKYKPKFEIDAENAFKILQGSSFYSDKSQCMRELLQNAEDATYLRVFIDHKEELLDTNVDIKDRYQKFLNFCRENIYAIKIIVTKKLNAWHICIQDSGIGMSKADLKYLFKIGSSKKNDSKQKIIKEMPEFAKPSGIFGVGFQSAFLLTDEVLLETRRYDDGDVLIASLNSPLKKGFISIKTDLGRFHKYGTKIEFDLKQDFLVVNKSERHLNYNNYYENLMNTFDFAKNDLSDAEIANLKDEICLFADKSNFSIELNGTTINEVKKDATVYTHDKEMFTISGVIGCDTSSIISADATTVRYRNQVIRKLNFFPYIKFIKMDVNILTGCAEGILALNRNELLTEYEAHFVDIVIDEIVNRINSNITSFSPKSQMQCAMFVEYYGKNLPVHTLNDIKSLWEKFIIRGEENEITIGKIIDDEKNVKIINSPSRMFVKISEDSVILCGNNGDYVQFLVDVLVKNGYKFNISSEQDSEFLKCGVYSFDKKTEKNEIDMESWLYFHNGWMRRSLMPCLGFEKLSLKKDLKVVGSRDPIAIFEKITYPKTACPYMTKKMDDGRCILEWRADDEFYNWVFDNRVDANVTLDEIKLEFEKLKEKFDQYVLKINDEKSKD